MSNSLRIAFFGIGNMGGPMARNLIKAGHQVSVFDLSDSLVAQLVEAGARAGGSAEGTVEGAEVVISMLPSAAAVANLYQGDNDLLSVIDAKALIIDCSTIDAATTRQMAAAAAERGRTLIDAPVSGGVGGAEAGTLTFICGGPAAAVEQARPILAAMGRNIFHAGDHGAGQIAKICNNMLLAIHMLGTCEALQLGVDNGLDPAVLSDIMLASSGRNWSLEVYNPWPGVMETAPASRNYQGGFAVDLMLKDLGLALENVLAVRGNAPLGTLAKNLYGLHAARGNGRLDFSSIQQILGRDPQ